jgi:teichuronic acid biosynthesis glycosyltransferase TuaG
MLSSKISVIIPFYNEINLIGRCVFSVYSELNGYYDYEVIICNDGDFENSYIISKIDCLVDNINVVRNIYSSGPGGARNTGLDIAQGDLIAFLDADDFWLPGKIAEQILLITSGATFVATAYRIDSSSTTIQPPASIDQALDIFLRRGIGTSTVMISKKLLSSFRFKDIRFAQDIDFWYALAHSPHFRYAAVEVCCVEYSTGGTTKNKWVQLQYLHKVLRINDVPWLQYFRVLFSYVFTGIYNHYIKRLFS